MTDSQSLNLYSYVRNRPTVLIDPDGHESDPCSTNADSCKVKTSTSITVGGTLFGGGSVVTISQTTTTSSTDQNGNNIEVSTTHQIQAVYDEKQNVKSVAEKTITDKSVNGKCGPDSYKEGDWKAVKMSGSDLMNAMGAQAGEVMSQLVYNATPQVITGAVSSAVHHPWETLERGAGGALMALCFVGEPCGAVEAGLSLLVGGAAAGKEIFGDQDKGEAK